MAEPPQVGIERNGLLPHRRSRRPIAPTDVSTWSDTRDQPCVEHVEQRRDAREQEDGGECGLDEVGDVTRHSRSPGYSFRACAIFSRSAALGLPDQREKPAHLWSTRSSPVSAKRSGWNRVRPFRPVASFRPVGPGRPKRPASKALPARASKAWRRYSPSHLDHGWHDAAGDHVPTSRAPPPACPDCRARPPKTPGSRPGAAGPSRPRMDRPCSTRRFSPSNCRDVEAGGRSVNTAPARTQPQAAAIRTAPGPRTCRAGPDRPLLRRVSIPSCRNPRRDKEPVRLDNLPPSSPTSSGRCANLHGVRVSPQCRPDVELHRRVGDVILAADDVGDAGREVVHDGGEGVERRTVCADEHRVGNRGGAALACRPAPNPARRWPRRKGGSANRVFCRLPPPRRAAPP